MNQSRITTSGAGSRATSKMTVLAVYACLFAALTFSGCVYHSAQSAHYAAEVRRYENELRLNAGRSIEQKTKYLQYRKDL
jgi:hypothetical protein